MGDLYVFQNDDIVRCVNDGKRPLADTEPEGLIVGDEYTVLSASPGLGEQGQALVLVEVRSPHWTGAYHSSHFELVKRGE